MGLTNSKAERSNALKLCRERKRFMKQAIDSRYALAAAHVCYLQSLKNIGIALRRFAEAPVLSGPDTTPPHCSHPSVNLSASRISYMVSSGAGALTITMSPPPTNMYVEECEFPMPPPPPSSWDYFDTSDERFKILGQDELDVNFDDVGMDKDFGGKYVDLDNTNGILDENIGNNAQQRVEGGVNVEASEGEVSGSIKDSILRKNMCAEKEDASEFITQRAKDFVSSIKDVDNRFFRASESGKEVSRMLESSKIRVGYSEATGSSSSSINLASFGVDCFRGTSANTSNDHSVAKVITWKRTTSSQSSSSRSPLTTTKDENYDSGSDFVEDFSMISGSHSSTLDRLYAWERRLYDEVKASESIQKEYDRRCNHLRHQFAKDISPQIIDKTRSVVKDLHSRIGVAIQAVDSISKRIEKMRDEELLPQLLELIQGLIKMWKAMLECHHSQYITISLAYHQPGTSSLASHGEIRRQMTNQLQDEVEYHGLSFAKWINSYISYVESLNSWLQVCILQPRERHKGRRGLLLSPRRYLAPPIFVLCRDWTGGIKNLPSQELSDAIRAFVSDLRGSVRRQEEEELVKKGSGDDDLQKNGAESKEEEDEDSKMQGSMKRVVEKMTKFSEASMKMCEDIQKKCESARNAFDNYRAPPRSFSI